MDLKLQSAVEYLSTYGWMILAIVIILSALVALGIFNPSTYVNSTCVLPAGFSCKPLVFSSNGLLTFTVTQFTTSPITVTAVGCTSNESVLYNKQLSPSVNLPIDGNATFTAMCYQGDAGFTSGIGGVFRGYVVINYTENDTALPHLAIGNSVFKVNFVTSTSTT